jgi:hypothetical protein
VGLHPNEGIPRQTPIRGCFRCSCVDSFRSFNVAFQGGAQRAAFEGGADPVPGNGRAAPQHPHLRPAWAAPDQEPTPEAESGSRHEGEEHENQGTRPRVAKRGAMEGNRGHWGDPVDLAICGKCAWTAEWLRLNKRDPRERQRI